jgi:hypothetical protein
VIGMRTPPVVFAGLSISASEAQSLLPAVVRGPVRAGDLDGFDAGQIVVIIDGDLTPNKLITSEEIQRLVEHGVRAFGAASVGAWRASDRSTGMRGFGWVYEAYRRGTLVGRDEIAALYDPTSHQRLTMPLVNVRFYLEAEVVRGALPGRLAARAMRGVKQVPLADRDSETLARTVAEITAIPPAPFLDIKAEDARGILSVVRSLYARSVECEFDKADRHGGHQQAVSSEAEPVKEDTRPRRAG